jgi:Uncharacterized conserved protein
MAVSSDDLKESGMGTIVTLQVESQVMEAELNDSVASKTFIEALPMTLAMSKWGGEYYGSIPVQIPSHEDRKEVFGIGEVALWPSGNGFCIFFGPTPASEADEPRMASPGVSMGQITSGLDLLSELGSSLQMKISVK